MKFLLTGVETNNKGAELMLYAILQEIERKFPGSTVYIEKNRVRQGIKYVHTSLNFKAIEPPYTKILERLHINGILRKLHIPVIRTFVSVPEIDYLLDGSGLHFTDQMTNAEQTKYWAHLYKQAKKYNAKIVFLPQGFGPIENEATKESVKLLFKNADLVYAREYVSRDYLLSVDGIDKSKLRVCTDFTSLVEGKFPKSYEHLKDGVCVIPNMQMVNKGVVTLDEYITYLNKIIGAVAAKGKKVYLLNHQGVKDEQLMKLCKERLGNSTETVTGLNALDTKGLISTAYMVITSRFHGLASALNSCVPSLATSWSHKYKCLFEDYGQHDCVLSVKDIDADIKKISEFLDLQNNKNIRAHLQEQQHHIRQQAQEMWNTIWALK